MTRPEEPRDPLPLEYHAPGGDDPLYKGATVPARIVAGFFAWVLLALTALLWWMGIERSRSPVQFVPAIVVSAAGAIFCLLVALGLVGRHRRT